MRAGRGFQPNECRETSTRTTVRTRGERGGTAAEGTADESDPTRRDVLARTGGSVAAGVAAA
ncbi:hypothetical protein, partial [Halogeometricum sp. CBA1124]|uniref:hypothetical protein n=1 Tax=Halogeometricum sp. CBA1124 TaxID=2668071 RepID=UPI00142C4398